jgi:hypothetical protein
MNIKIFIRKYSLSGTSASSPFIAGLFSNINAKRLAMGKSSLGWVNPTLYQTYTQYTNGNTCVYVCMDFYISLSIYMYIYIYIYINICGYKYICVYIYI